MKRKTSLITAAALAACANAALAQTGGNPQAQRREPMHFCELLDIADKVEREIPDIQSSILQQMVEIGVDAMREDAGRRYGETLTEEERAALAAKGNLKSQLTSGAKASCAAAKIG